MASLPSRDVARCDVGMSVSSAISAMASFSVSSRTWRISSRNPILTSRISFKHGGNRAFRADSSGLVLEVDRACAFNRNSSATLRTRVYILATYRSSVSTSSHMVSRRASFWLLENTRDRLTFVGCDGARFSRVVGRKMGSPNARMRGE